MLIWTKPRRGAGSAPAARGPEGRVMGSYDPAANGGRVVALGSVADVERTVGPQSVRRLEREGHGDHDPLALTA